MDLMPLDFVPDGFLLLRPASCLVVCSSWPVPFGFLFVGLLVHPSPKLSTLVVLGP